MNNTLPCCSRALSEIGPTTASPRRGLPHALSQSQQAVQTTSARMSASHLPRDPPQHATALLRMRLLVGHAQYAEVDDVQRAPVGTKAHCDRTLEAARLQV